MRLIDADALKIRDISPSYWQVVDGVTEYDIEKAPTVDAVPVSFINEQIEKLQGLADYEFIESGGYLGECNHELRALQDLLKHWAERKEE